MEHGCPHYQKKWDRDEERRKRGEEEKKNLALTRPLNSGRSTPSPTRKSRRKVAGGGACGNFLPVSSVHTARSGAGPERWERHFPIPWAAPFPLLFSYPIGTGTLPSYPRGLY